MNQTEPVTRTSFKRMVQKGSKITKALLFWLNTRQNGLGNVQLSEKEARHWTRLEKVDLSERRRPPWRRLPSESVGMYEVDGNNLEGGDTKLLASE